MSNIKVLTPEGRFRFIHVFTPTQDMKGNEIHDVTLLIPKTSSLSTLEKAREDAAKEEFKGKIPGPLRRITGGQKPICKDGDEYYDTRDDDKKPMYEEYRGCWVLASSCPITAPLHIRDENNAEIFDAAQIYDGAYGQLVLNFSAYSAKARKEFAGGPMLSVTLLAVRKTRDGEAIETVGSSKGMSEEEVNAFFGAASSAPLTGDNDDDL